MNMNIDFEQLVNKFSPMIVEYGTQVLFALSIFLVGKWLAKVVASFVVRQLNQRDLDPMVSIFAGNLIHWALLAFVMIAALARVGIQTASFVAIIGAASLAIGLALQGSLSNFASGVLMIIFRPFKLGDYIEAGGQAGVVSDIRIFSIQLLTPDNKEVIIPNSAVMDGSITNYSAQEKRRVDLTIGVSYEAFLPDVKNLLEEIVAQEESVLHQDANMVVVSELGDSSVNFVVRSWVKTADYWDVYFRLLETIKLKLDEAKVSIPYPQMDVHVVREN